MQSRNEASVLFSADSDSERRSTLIDASAGIEFTEVPPSISPTLNDVRGFSGTGTFTKRAIPRASAWIGFGAPKSDQLCPPGPLILISKRREARAELAM